ncbi:MAG: hypothetical protein J7480_00795 [Microbacteriaceae bacterium]|nr:hypothetical protein [Microbacteriaceae bacterium]
MGARHVLVRSLLGACSAIALVAGLTACMPNEPGPGGTGTPAPTTTAGAPADPGAPAAPGTTETRTIDAGSGGSAREYALHVPAAMDESPDLVVVLHWWGGSMEEASAAHGWADASDQRGFLVAFGSGVDHSWNAGGCCGTAKDKQIDDLAYIDAVIDAVSAEYGVDRVVVAGTSNGAMMALRYGCETDRDVGLAAVSGSLFVDCADGRPKDVVMVNGLADETVRFDGQPGSSGIDGMPVPDAFATWRSIDGCGEPARTDSPDGQVHTDAATCADGRRTELITIEGAGHQWPYNQYDATEWIAEFYGLGA